MARKEPTVESERKRLANLREARRLAKERAAELRRQKRLLLSVARRLDDDQKAAIRKAADDRITQLLGLSVQYCEDVLTGDIRQDRERGGEKIKRLDLSDIEYARLVDVVSERVMDRGGLHKKSGLEVSGATMAPLRIILEDKEASTA